MRIIEKTILDMTAKETAQCKSLSLRNLGLMCEDLVDWKAYESRPNRAKRKSRVWMMQDDNDRLIAWALVTPRWNAPGYDAQFYVRVRERGLGHGSVLMQKVLDYTPSPNVYPHDRMSGDFFKKHRESIRFKKSESKWLE